jgi:hypothetical protein
MSKKMVQKLLATLAGSGFVLLLATASAQAFGLGIPLDGFITQLETSVTGTGMVIGLIGGAGMIMAKMENSYSPLFANFLSYFVNAGILGGLVTILGAVGLVTGATLVF